MKLSVIIVNYNVEHFLEQCLLSVSKAIENIAAEVFIVDNDSTDNSLSMITQKFPQFHLIANKENVGFSKANNQAIRLAKGEYVLLLNPDTIVEEDTFEKCIHFFETTPDAGALGVKMINGKGEFLPESKRGLPLPNVAFYKIFGLAKFFPKSKKFGSYHLTYLNNDEIHAVDVLSGAFMFIRKKVLDEIGLLDEDYFMYGEDIDLSYRITKHGYKNYYFPETKIIHYKGESTKKGSLNYVVIFYRAMKIFAHKHFSQHHQFFFNLLINGAIYFRASLAMIKRIFLMLLLPIVDFTILSAGLFAIAKYWEHTVLLPRESSFPPEVYYWILPLYALIWILGIVLYRGYRKPIQLSSINKGFIAGTVLFILLYALLPETFRFSRAVVVFGAMFGGILLNLSRYLFHKLHFRGLSFGKKERGRLLILGNEDEATRVLRLVQMTHTNLDFLGIATNEIQSNSANQQHIVGHFSQLSEILTIYKIKDIVFCNQSFSTKEIIDLMERYLEEQIGYKIALIDSKLLIGSSAIYTADDLFKQSQNAIHLPHSKRKKRIFDIISTILMLLLTPFTIWIFNRKKAYIEAVFQVLSGKKTWIGYYVLSNLDDLPKLKSGILKCSDALTIEHLSEDLIHKINQQYACNYQVINDMQILWKAYSKIAK